MCYFSNSCIEYAHTKTSLLRTTTQCGVRTRSKASVLPFSLQPPFYSISGVLSEQATMDLPAGWGLGLMISQKELFRRVLYFCIWLIVQSQSPANGKETDLGSLPSTKGFQILGLTSGDNTGSSVCGAGDINGDNLADVLILSKGFNSNAGVVYAIYGRPPESSVDIDLSTMYNADVHGFRILGSDGLSSMSGLGDVNGDGLGDIIVGAETGSAAIVIFGQNLSAPGSYIDDVYFSSFVTDAPFGFRITGGTSVDSVGTTVSGPGDINNDGMNDILISAPFYQALGAGSGAGIVYVVFGRNVVNGGDIFDEIDLSVLGDVSPNPIGYAILGSVAQGNIGVALSGIGDINRDGVGDIAIGAPTMTSNGRSGNGVSYVVFGRDAHTASNPFDTVDLSYTGSFWFQIDGAEAGDQSGISVSGAGDVSGDGFDDFIIGASYARTSEFVVNTGITYVVYGRDIPNGGSAFEDMDLAVLPSNEGFRILGNEDNEISGYGVSGAGDMNGDGLRDVVVGAYGANGTGITYVVYGRLFEAGSTSLPDIELSALTTDASLGFRILGASENDQSGISVSGAGDVNGDGLADVIVGADLADPPSVFGPDAGIVYVVFGSYPDPTGAPTPGPTLYPSRKPSRGPTLRPTWQPLTLPTVDPTAVPSPLPSSQPSVQPSALPSGSPSTQPSTSPSDQPSARPTGQPSAHPSTQPSSSPSSQPTTRPTVQPTTWPTSQPTMRPSTQPSVHPSTLPSSSPSSQPTTRPTVQPTTWPTSQPSARPSGQPSVYPSTQPSRSPSSQPSTGPTVQPTTWPTSQPSARPSGQPSVYPSTKPSNSPSSQPSTMPTTQPSEKPSTQTSAIPSVQPSDQPSSKPSCRPSSQPSDDPSAQPISTPSSQPSCKPSAVPTIVPTWEPSVKPSLRSEGTAGAPSSVPTHRPTHVPSSLVTLSHAPTGAPLAIPGASAIPTESHSSSRPTVLNPGAPSAQPTVLVSGLPSAFLSLSPSTEPSVQPSPSPSRTTSTLPTPVASKEWATMVTRKSSLSQLSVVSGQVWACGVDGNQTTTSCALLDARTGDVSVMYQFHWTHTLSPVISITAAGGSVVLSARLDSLSSLVSEIANCAIWNAQLFCDVTSFPDMRFMAVSYLPYPNRIVHFGTNSVYLSATIIDVTPNTVRSFIYSLFNMKSVVLSQVQSPPNFVGSFVAGTAVRDVGSPANFIVAGMLRTDGGVLSMMSIAPVEGDITTTVDLVTATALETIGPDLFVVGGLTLSDGTGKHAYLLRVNALYNTVMYCVRYRAFNDVISEHRRALTSTSELSSIARGVAHMNSVLYLLVESTQQNITSATVLTVNADSGAITKQVHLSAPEGSLTCSDITSSGLYLVVACILQRNSTTGRSVVISVDVDLTFSALPVGIVRNDSTLFHSEAVQFHRSVVSVTTTSTRIAATNYQFNTADQSPSRRPSTAPSSQPSSQPSSAPSAQPSSSPTSRPTVSPQPSSTPSTSGPTNTHKPSAAPTIVPTAAPTVTRTANPSTSPSTKPSLRPSPKPSALPTKQPTATPSFRPTRAPTLSPTRAPSTTPSAVPVRVPSAPPTAAPTEGSSASSTDRSTVIWSAVGGALLLCVCGYGWYQYKLHRKAEEAKAKRKAEYFAYQALLVAALEKEREEIIHQIRLEDARKEKNRKKQRARAAGGNGASTGVGASHVARTDADTDTRQVGGFGTPLYRNASADESTTTQSAPPPAAVLLPRASSSGGNSSHSSSSATSSDTSSSYNISSLHTSEADFADYY